MILNSTTQTKEKWDSLVLSSADFCMTGSCHGIPCLHFLFFCLEATVKKNTWMRTISATVMVIDSEVRFWKLLDFSYVQSSFWTITRHIDNGIWKIHYSWRFYGHGSTYILILSWINIMKWKWERVPCKLSVAQKSEPVLRRTLHWNTSLIIVFFASQTNLVFKLNLALTE